jgi:hypothetical protein
MDKDTIISAQTAVIAHKAFNIAQLEQLLNAALLRVVDFDARLKSNSGSSSRPPGCNELKKKSTFLRLSWGKRGGKFGNDFEGSYLKQADVQLLLFDAHGQREFHRLVECIKLRWASLMHELLMNVSAFGDNSKHIKPSKKDKFVLTQYKTIQEETGKEEYSLSTVKKGRPAKSEEHKLLERLRKYKYYILSFTLQTGVPFASNHAHRNIRRFNTKLNVSGYFSKLESTRYYLRIKSFCSPTKEHGLSAYYELLNTMGRLSLLCGRLQTT